MKAGGQKAARKSENRQGDSHRQNQFNQRKTTLIVCTSYLHCLCLAVENWNY
jgi:hypothetical protein